MNGNFISFYQLSSPEENVTISNILTSSFSLLDLSPQYPFHQYLVGCLQNVVTSVLHHSSIFSRELVYCGYRARSNYLVQNRTKAIHNFSEKPHYKSFQFVGKFYVTSVC